MPACLAASAAATVSSTVFDLPSVNTAMISKNPVHYDSAKTMQSKQDEFTVPYLRKNKGK